MNILAFHGQKRSPQLPRQEADFKFQHTAHNHPKTDNSIFSQNPLQQWFSTWGSFEFFLGVARASDKNIHIYFSILYFLYGTTFCRSQNNRIAWQKC